ncbi:hypothetical protein EQG41_20600 [Billgrantia azerbaijanica]|nr:hypothetical protein EQG41_20600 [Halomonas azerbaijanica]
MLRSVLMFGAVAMAAFSQILQAQDEGVGSATVGLGSSELRLPDGTAVEIEGVAPSQSREWVPYGKDISGENLKKAFEMQGVWAEGFGDIDLEGASEYDLYLNRSSIGEVEYLAIPEGESSQPIQISSAGAVHYGGMGESASEVASSWNPFTKSAEEMRAEIISAIESTLDELCGMRARPQQIRALASAAGIIEFEATWSATEICE